MVESSNISVTQLEEYFQCSQPLIVRRRVEKWPAFEKWNFQWFKQHYGEVWTQGIMDIPNVIPIYRVCDDGKIHKRMQVKEFINHIERSQQPSYLNQQTIRLFPGVEEDLALDHLTRFNKGGTSNVWISSKGAVGGFHIDGRDNFLCQIVGTKEILLVPPNEGKYMYPFPDNPNKSQLNPRNGYEVNKLFPKFNLATVFKGSLHPGDVLILPREWWHFIYSSENSISVNYWFDGNWPHVRQYSFEENQVFWKTTYYATLVRDFILTFFERPYKRLLSQPPRGTVLYFGFFRWSRKITPLRWFLANWHSPTTWKILWTSTETSSD